MKNSANQSQSFVGIFNEAAMTLLSFFSISLMGLVFGNIASYLQAIIFLRNEALIKSILGVFILIAVCVVYFIQSDHKGYKLEVGLKFNVKQIMIGTLAASVLYILICILGFFYYQGNSYDVPMIIKLLFYPGFAINQSLDMLFYIEIDLFICSLMLLPAYLAIRFIAIFRGRGIVLEQRESLRELAEEYKEKEKLKKGSWKDSILVDYSDRKDIVKNRGNRE